MKGESREKREGERLFRRFTFHTFDYLSFFTFHFSLFLKLLNLHIVHAFGVDQESFIV